MATGSKPDTQEDFPNLCEEVFHRYGNILNFGFYIYAHFTGIVEDLRAAQWSSQMI